MDEKLKKNIPPKAMAGLPTSQLPPILEKKAGLSPLVPAWGLEPSPSRQPFSLEMMVGQMLLLGFSGATANAETRRLIGEGHVGGLGLFNICPEPKESNITSPRQLKELCAALQAEAPIPLFLAVDQEGGRVARLSERNGFERPPSPREMAKGGRVFEEYGRIAKTLRQCGINLNFAPCADLDINPENPIIGALGRSFGAEPSAVTRHIFEAWQAQRAEGIISCLKHFPGHGSGFGDSHLGSVDVTESFTEAEYEPYAALIAGGYNELILTAHVINGHISPHPASLAPEYAALLRGWGFEGLIVTDDLSMGALGGVPRQEALIGAVLAGADLIASFNNLAPYDPEASVRTHGLLMEAVESGRLTPARIEESFERIMRFKAERLL